MIADIADSISGSMILDLEETPDGAHVTLDDERIVIFYGVQIIAIAQVEPQTIQ